MDRTFYQKNERYELFQTDYIVKEPVTAAPGTTASYESHMFAGAKIGGLKVTNDCEVTDTAEQPIPGLFACGELVGGLFYHNYPGGTGLVAGSVFGRIAGASAGKAVR